uniref:Uncharacterized protein n=1 Tax=Eutreptiella gymnastica TaxID=73025 RepID=A0A7S1HY61_9EUGL|mmetsp:Transcript_114277/g.198690  ORF Transcript_114277/g.198690 Transcript_114277/m.198690 type:complete len:122 (+) Transcript_114277:136-501(+)
MLVCDYLPTHAYVSWPTSKAWRMPHTFSNDCTNVMVRPLRSVLAATGCLLGAQTHNPDPNVETRLARSPMYFNQATIIVQIIVFLDTWGKRGQLIGTEYFFPCSGSFLRGRSKHLKPHRRI